MTSHSPSLAMTSTSSEGCRDTMVTCATHETKDDARHRLRRAGKRKHRRVALLVVLALLNHSRPCC